VVEGFKLLKGIDVEPVALPIPRDSAARLSTVQAIAETTGPGIQLPPQLRKKNAEFPWILRQIRSIETWSIHHASVLTQPIDLDMARGVTTALEAT